MLNDKTKNEWKLKVKSIFTEAQKKFTEDAETDELDLGGAEEDPDLQTQDNTEVVPVDDGAEEEQEPTITVTASLLKALLDYCSAPAEEEVLPMDPSVEGDATSGNSSMIAAPPATSAGIMEDEEVSDEAETVDGAEEVVDDSQVDAGCEISSDEIIQRLIDISAENGGEPLDVDVLNVVFSPESEEDVDDLGGDELDGNVELPATTGDQTLPPTA